LVAAGQPAAIIAAGGRGERAAGDVPKQFRPLCGRPFLAWSVDALRAAGCDPIVVVVPSEHLETVADELGESDVVLTAGGDSRQASVASGLDEVASSTVVIHDGARPLITPADVARVLEPLDRHDGAITAMPMDETLKRADDDRVLETVDRAGLWRVQTPQAFRTSVLRSAHEKALSDGYEGTDDAALVERAGGSVVLVTGSRLNLKVTYPEDFALAEALLESR
jgi:2-C-methyl-D-erythritol 4-phosphate cytidylyltransferase/2-C-methyl-D-erythritol 2,4-cyclodiphosphate synthase